MEKFLVSKICILSPCNDVLNATVVQHGFSHSGWKATTALQLHCQLCCKPLHCLQCCQSRMSIMLRSSVIIQNNSSDFSTRLKFYQHNKRRSSRHYVVTLVLKRIMMIYIDDIFCGIDRMLQCFRLIEQTLDRQTDTIAVNMICSAWSGIVMHN